MLLRTEMSPVQNTVHRNLGVTSSSRHTYMHTYTYAYVMDLETMHLWVEHRRMGNNALA